jgi:hypothetical protein
MRRTLRIALVCFALGLAASASGEELSLGAPELGQPDLGGGAGYHSEGSLLGGRTLGANHDVLFAQFGWPGISIAYLHGSTSKMDFGGEFTFNYGFDGIVHTAPGLKFAGVIRLNMYDKGKVSAGLRFDPGITMYFSGFLADQFAFGLAIPVALQVGVDLGDALVLNLGIAMPMTIFFTPDVFFELPILPGFGVQYNIDSHLSVTFDTGFGPDVLIGGGGAGTFFAFKTLLGVGYRL